MSTARVGYKSLTQAVEIIYLLSHLTEEWFISKTVSSYPMLQLKTNTLWVNHEIQSRQVNCSMLALHISHLLIISWLVLCCILCDWNNRMCECLPYLYQRKVYIYMKYPSQLGPLLAILSSRRVVGLVTPERIADTSQNTLLLPLLDTGTWSVRNVISYQIIKESCIIWDDVDI